MDLIVISLRMLGFVSHVLKASTIGVLFLKMVEAVQRKSLDLIHTDVCGKLNTKSLGGAEYFLTFTDDKTRFSYLGVSAQEEI